MTQAQWDAGGGNAVPEIGSSGGGQHDNPLQVATRGDFRQEKRPGDYPSPLIWWRRRPFYCL
jgi:hypothetical protein